MSAMTNEVETIDAIEVPGEWRAREQGQILDVIDKYGSFDEYGALDVVSVEYYLNTTRTYIYQTFGRFGRVVQYTNEVSEPTIQIIKDGSTDLQRSIHDGIRQYATVKEDGTIDGVAVYNGLKENSIETTNPNIYKIIGRDCRILVPIDDAPNDIAELSSPPSPSSSLSSSRPPRPSQDGSDGNRNTEDVGVEGVMDITDIIHPDEIPNDPREAFVRGWELHKKIQDFMNE